MKPASHNSICIPGGGRPHKLPNLAHLIIIYYHINQGEVLGVQPSKLTKEPDIASSRTKYMYTSTLFFCVGTVTKGGAGSSERSVREWNLLDSRSTGLGSLVQGPVLECP